MLVTIIGLVVVVGAVICGLHQGALREVPGSLPVPAGQAAAFGHQGPQVPPAAATQAKGSDAVPAAPRHALPRPHRTCAHLLPLPLTLARC